MTDLTSAAVADSGFNKSVPTPESPKDSGKWNSKGTTIGIAVSGVIVIIGLVLWAIQLTGGMVQTGMRNLDSWGLYITMFMFFVGLSAGGLIISSVPKAFGIKGFGGISKVAVMTSIAATIAAVGFVIVDMGQPLRVWELFAYSNLGSPLMWDIIVIATYLILSCVYLWAQIQAEKGKVSQKALRVISVIALVCAVLVHSVTAWIFSLQPAHEFWYTALLGPWFVSSALVCGTALVMLVCMGLSRAGYLEFSRENLVKLAKLLGAFVMVDLYFFACDLLTEGFPGADGAAVVQMLVSGPLAPFFWIEIIGCIVCAVICFTPSLRKPGILGIGCALAIIGIFCKRVQLLVGGFQLPNLDMPGALPSSLITNWSGTYEQAYAGLVYAPTMLEFGVCIGVIALAFLVFFLGMKLLPLRPKPEDK